MPIGDKPWGNFSEADYTPEQWHKACLIHLHPEDKVTGKGQCKLAVREPDGALNRNGVHAAAAALAGARTPLQAPPDEKRSAARKLISLYKELGEMAPESTYRIAGEKRPASK